MLGGRGSNVRWAALVDDHPSLRNVRQIARSLGLTHGASCDDMRAHSLAETELTLTYISKDRARAEAAFKKLQRVQDGEKAKTEYEAESQSVREKTVRLKTLRLAKEATNLAPSAKNNPIAAKSVRG